MWATFAIKLQLYYNHDYLSFSNKMKILGERFQRKPDLSSQQDMLTLFYEGDPDEDKAQK